MNKAKPNTPNTLRKLALAMMPSLFLTFAVKEASALLKSQTKAEAELTGDAPDVARRRELSTKFTALRLAQLSALLKLSDHPGLADALIGPTLDDTTTFDPDDEDARDQGTAIAARMLRGTISCLAELLPIYTHEHSHAALGRHYGYSPGVIIDVDIKSMDVPGKGTGLGVEVSGGRCRHATDSPIPPAQKAAISVAGMMGEMAIPASDLSGDDDLREVFTDVDFWAPVFRAVRENAEEGDPRPGNIFASHSGADSDAQDFYANAPTKAQRREAILAAGRVLQAKAKEISDKATHDALEHMRVLNVALSLMTTAHNLAEEAKYGAFGAQASTSTSTSTPTSTLQ